MATTQTKKQGFINARVNKRLKADAEKVLAKMSLSTSDLITLLLRQVVLTQSVPFEINIPNKETRKAMKELDEGKGQIYMGSTKDIFDSIVGKKRP